MPGQERAEEVDGGAVQSGKARGYVMHAGEVWYYAVLLLLLVLPAVVNLCWGPVWGFRVGVLTALVWFFFGRQTGLGEMGCLVHLGGLLGMLLHLLYLGHLWKQLLLQQLRLQ